MSLKQKVLKGVAWSALESWGNRIISVSVFFLLARLLEPESLGLVALASVFINFVQIFIDQGFSQAIIQREKLEPEVLDNAFWINLSLSIILTILSFFGADYIASIFKQPDLVPVIRWLSLGFLVSGLGKVQEAILIRNFKFQVLAFRSLFASIVSGVIGVVMAFMGWGVWSLVVKTLVFGFIQVLLIWIVSDWQPKFRFSKKISKDLFTFGINILGSKILNFSTRRADDFLIGYFFGPVTLGYYNIAYRFLLMITELFIGVTSRLALPIFSQLQSEPKKLCNVFYKITETVCLITFPIFIFISVLAPQIIQIFVGDNWNKSIPIMQILSWVGIVHTLTFFNGSVILAMGKPLWNFKFKLLSAIVIVSTFLICLRWNITGVAMGYVIANYLLYPISFLLVDKLINLEFNNYFRRLKIPFLGTLFMWGCLSIFQLMIKEFSLNIFLLLFFEIILGSTIYFFTIYILNPSGFTAINSIKLYIKK